MDRARQVPASDLAPLKGRWRPWRPPSGGFFQSGWSRIPRRFCFTRPEGLPYATPGQRNSPATTTNPNTTRT